jgi:hypothetical protein
MSPATIAGGTGLQVTVTCSKCSAELDAMADVVRRLLALQGERDRAIKALDEMRAINAMLCHWYDEGMELLQKAGIPDDEESPLADLADNMTSHLLSSDGYDFKKVRIFKGMETRVALLEELLRRVQVDYCTPHGEIPWENTKARVLLMNEVAAALETKP